MHEWGERVRGLSRLKVSEVRGEGGTLLTQAQGQCHGLAMCNPPPLRPIAPSSTGQASKGGWCTSGSGHTEPGSLLFEKVLVSSGRSAIATGKARSGTTGVEGATKPRRASGPIVGETMKAPAEPRSARTTTPPPRILPIVHSETAYKKRAELAKLERRMEMAPASSFASRLAARLVDLRTARTLYYMPLV